VVDVVIAGAGPNGLMLAGELGLAGIRPVVLDPMPGPDVERRANGIIGQGVRILDHRGLYGTLAGTTEPPRLNPRAMFAAFPLELTLVPDPQVFLLPVQQPRLVRVLADWARDYDVDIRWGHVLTGFDEHPDGVTVHVTGPDGRYDLSAEYLVGADGGASVTRKLAGIDFPGNDQPMSLAELEASAKRVLGADVQFRPAHPDTPLDLRRFSGINSRIASRYQLGRVILVGDAAHVHSPMGGPGLNLGLQDAVNLGWKLAAVLHGRVEASLLATYEAERRPAAERVIMHSRAQLALVRPGPEVLRAGHRSEHRPPAERPAVGGGEPLRHRPGRPPTRRALGARLRCPDR